MSKVMVVGATGLGATSVTVGGYYLFNGSEAGTEPSETDQDAGISTGSSSESSPTSTKDLEFETSDTFKSNMKNAKCVKDYFGEITEKSDALNMSTNTPDTDFFKSSQGDSYKSCLSVSGKVTNYSGDKWSGTFTWLWTFISGDEGFINFNIAEPSAKEDGKLKFTGIFYLVGKTNGKWEIKYQIEVEEESAQEDTHFPKASNDLKSVVDGDYWGFANDKSKWEKLCKSGECSTSSETKFVNKNLSFKKETDSSQKPIDWSSDFGWWTNLYAGISGWDLKTKISGFTGKWSSSGQ